MKIKKVSQGAFGIIIENGSFGGYLLSQRWHGGKWNLAGGGRRIGESIEEAVIREVKEETGLIVKPEEWTSLHYGRKIRTVAFAFLCKVTGGTLRESVYGEVRKNAFFQWPAIEEMYRDGEILPISFRMLEDASLHPNHWPVTRNKYGRIVVSGRELPE